MDFDFNFASSDYAAFDRFRHSLLDDMATWATQGSRDGFAGLYVEQFLSWNFEYRGQPLRTLNQADLGDYLLSWLPRKYAGGPDEAPAICHNLELLIEFLAANDSLDNSFERAASLITFVAGAADDVAEAMANPSNFGMSKSLLSAPLIDSAGVALPNLDELLSREDLEIEELQQLLDERMQAFNALSFEERKRLTDTPEIAGSPIPLPFTYIPPHPAEVEATASFADVVLMADRFVEIACDVGIALTSAGNIKIADARQLAVELDTGDDVDGITSSLDLRWVTLIDDLTSAAGAVDRMKTTIRADRTWLGRSATDKATLLSNIILDTGFLSSAEAGPEWLHQLRQLVDDGVPHWLSPGLVEGNQLEVDGVAELAVEVAAMQPSSRRATIGEAVFDDWVIQMVAELLRGLERFGLLIWEGAEQVPSVLGGTEVEVGGQVVLTPLGRHVMPAHIEEAGYSFESIDGIEDASAAQVVDIAFAGGLSGSEILERWRVDEPVAVRAQALATHIMDGDSADRLIGFDVFAAIGPEVAGPIVRQLLDSPAGSHAAAFLLDHGLATSEELGGFIDLTPLVDMLTMTSGEPEVFDEIFREAVATIDGDLLEELWRHDQPETKLVLEAAGKHVTDKALAKRARGALRKHQSWLSNQGR